MDYEVNLEDRREQHTAVVRGHVDTDGVGPFIGAAFGEVLAGMSASGLPPAGPPFARYRIVDDGFDIEAGFPVPGVIEGRGRVEASTLPGGSIAMTMHVGSYAGIAPAYEAVEAWTDEFGYVIDGDPWEAYLDGPEVAQPRTLVCFPCHAA